MVINAITLPVPCSSFPGDSDDDDNDDYDDDVGGGGGGNDDDDDDDRDMINCEYTM
jgi:hypothetical protein